MDRQLASIVQIANIQPIPNADAIEVASVKGWKVVIKKGELKIGDKAVYFEIDSFLPIKPQFEFLRKSSYRKLSDGAEGFRLKTIKLRGQLSQGLLVPLATFNLDDLEIGTDVTEQLGVVKYEPPVPAQLAGEIKGLFPSFIPKTDEIRVQNLDIDVRGERVYITEKLDGSSFTAYFKDGEFGICSRNYELKETDSNAFWNAAKLLNLREKLTNHGKNIAIQGELIGPGIQGNPYMLKYPTIQFFTGYNIDEKRRMYFDEIEWLFFRLDLTMVPVVDPQYFIPVENTVDKLLELAIGKSHLNEETEREGIVIRGYDKDFSFKSISNVYLLEHEN